MSIKTVPPEGMKKEKLDRLIKSLEHQISMDTDEKSRAIHTDALYKLREAHKKAVGKEVE